MIRLKVKLALFNLLSKLVFTAVALAFLPEIIERINLRQVDNELVSKREQVIGMISRVGIEPFIVSDSATFGSFNILKEEFISIEKTYSDEDLNYIEVTRRLIENEEIEYRVINYTIRIDGQMYLIEIGKSLSSILQTKKNITRIIIVFLFLIIILTFITDLYYNRYLLLPLDNITSKLKGISSPALFDRSAVKTSTSDFHQLDHALNELMERINELFRKEKETTINISHELLTPVSVLRTKLENMLLSEKVDEEASIKIEESLRTLHRLQTLVNSLLFIARIESRQYLLEESFSVKELIHEITGEINPVAVDAGITINEEMDDFTVKNANRSLLFSMFYNVVNNAVRNTSSGGNIYIKGIRLPDDGYEVSITDTGKGMTEAQLETLFSRFKTRTEASETGAGIGLAITKTIADLHDIEISVSSEIEKGTTFLFNLKQNS